MPLQTATNPDTKETVVLVGDQWKPATQTATGPGGAKAYLVGNEWLKDDATPSGVEQFGQGVAQGAKSQVKEQVGALTSGMTAEGREMQAHPLTTALKGVMSAPFEFGHIGKEQAQRAAKADTGAAKAISEHRLPEYAGELTGRAGVVGAEALATEGAGRALEGVRVRSPLATPAEKAARQATKDAKVAEASKKEAARNIILKGGLGSKEAAQKVRATAKEHREVGAGDPKLLDVLPKSGVEVVEKAGKESPEAATKLREHAEATEKSISERAAKRAETLAPTEPATETHIKALKEDRDRLAEEQYREPYSHKMPVDDDLIDILDVKAGSAAIRTARETAIARARRYPESAQQAQELKALEDYRQKLVEYRSNEQKGEFATKPSADAQRMLDDPSVPQRVKDSLKQAYGWKEAAPPQPPEISAGALHRVQVALRDIKSSVGEKNPGLAGGLQSRKQDLDEYLDKVPGLKEANEAFKERSGQIEQAEFSKNIADMEPTEFKDSLKNLTPDQRRERANAVAQMMVRNLGKTSGSVGGIEDALITGRNARANLRELFSGLPGGEKVADQYMRAIELMQKGLSHAKQAAGGTEARAGGADDLVKDAASSSARIGVMSLIGHPTYAVYDAMRFIHRWAGSVKGEEEARQIAEWATDQKDVEKTLQEIAEAADPAKRPRSKLPKDILDKINPARAAATAGIVGQTDDRRTDQK